MVLYSYNKSALETEILNQPVRELDSYYSDKKLGSFIENGNTYFRLFTPNAVKVVLVTFNSVDDFHGIEHPMKPDDNAVWEIVLNGEHPGMFYGFKVYHSHEELNDDKPLCLDPYSKAVATYNTYMNPRKSVVYNAEYNWEDDEFIRQDWRDLIIYEMHIRDITKHSSSGASFPGQYKGLTEKGIPGGIDYIKSLGVNTVELLPSQEFGNIEIPYNKSMAGRVNTWNPYERNHWGYMTASYFAPEAYYTQQWDKLEWNTWMGENAAQVNEFKNMIKSFHKEGIAVIMDVVFNHISEYELGNLKQIDKEYYFRLDERGNFISESYCGNDLKTERPMVRRLIIDSIIYWMKEYHIDGFRFDLARLIDWQTVEDIIHEAKKINPDVVFIGEPWGGGYDPQGFSIRGWAAWNDQIRNGIKGENPYNGHGWIFGRWFGNNNIGRIRSYVNGTLAHDQHGLFHSKEHSVNYLESHDGYTLGDFIRIGTGELTQDQIIDNVEKHVKLSPLQLRLHKLAALFLFTSQGITMIQSGQEFARSKIISKDTDARENHKGILDHNSYNKDNETNYINYDHVEINKQLWFYYTGLIKLRNTYSAFRHAAYENINFVEDPANQFALAYSIQHKGQYFFVMLNASKSVSTTFNLPEGKWEVLVNHDYAGVRSLGIAENDYKLFPQTGSVLKHIH